MAEHEFAPIYYPLNIPIDGFREVVIHYNVLATRGQVNQLRNSLSREASKPVIGKIENWPDGVGIDPFGDECPLAVLTWVCGTGPLRATVEWTNINPI